MTMTFHVKTMPVSGVGGLRGFKGPEQTTLCINYVSHGEFVLSQPHRDYVNKPFGGPSVGLELGQFSEIIDAFQSKEVSDNCFEPFYQAVLEPKGMQMSKSYTSVYFIRDLLSLKGKIGMLLEERFITWGGVPTSSVRQVSLTLEEFSEAYQWCKNYKSESVDIELPEIVISEIKINYE